MEAGLTAETFNTLLNCLDRDREQAGEKYEELRRTLVKFFEWRGAQSPEEHADEAFNRIARKLNEGVPVKNLAAYSYEVARLIFLESTKRVDAKNLSLDSVNIDPVVEDPREDVLAKELRLTCLEDCLATFPRESSELILEYYQYEERTQVKRRRAMASRLGLRRDALGNRMQRLRDKLEHCVANCLRKKSAI